MPLFGTLWRNHPTTKGDAPLLDKRVYENQCAINLSAACMRSDMSLTGYPGVLSWEKNKPRYAIRAQELANWFTRRESYLNAKVQIFGGKQVFHEIKNKTGIIFLQNYWGSGHQGDHIDLWNGSRLTDWTTWVRIHMRIGSVGVHSFNHRLSDFEQAESAWFWSLP
jgi:Type VI secretion system (T6SS), amidase effector protein 4